MQPSPIAETSRLLFPSVRFFMLVLLLTVSLIPRLGSNIGRAVARSFRFVAYSSRHVKKLLVHAQRSGAAILDLTTL